MKISRISPDTLHVPTATRLSNLIAEFMRCAPMINDALYYSGGTHTLDDVFNMVLADKLILYPLPNSVMLLELVTYPQANHLHLFLGGGDLEEILAEQDNVIAIAKQNNCRKVTVSGRKGWAKPLQKQGWKPQHYTVALDVEIKNE